MTKRLKTILSTVGILACVTSPDALMAQDAPDPLRKVTVSSVAVIDAEPSYVLYKAFLSTRKEGADKARNSALSASDKLLDALTGSGIAANDISQGQILVTMSHADKSLFSSSSKQSYEFDAKTTLAFKIRDLSKTGTILDAVAKADVSRLSDPAFIIENADELRQQARDKALEKARKKAGRYAEKAGLKLANLLVVDEERPTDDPSMWPYKGKSSYGYSGYEQNGLKPGSTKSVPLSIAITTSWQLIK